MKKSLLALAVLTAFAGAASAQSSVTLYGRVDLAVGKGAGTAQKLMGNGSGSRFGVRGVEDLGGGLQALFNIEHRYEADTGAVSSTSRFWTGRSLVGLQGGFGQVVLGREYTPAFLQSQLVADPWGWDTVVSGSYMQTAAGSRGTAGITGGGIAPVRNDSSLTYKFSASGFTFGAQIAEATDTIVSKAKRPSSLALSYAAGPLTAAIAHDRPGDTGAKWTTVNAAYDLGMAKIGGLIGKGTNATGQDVKSWLLTATAPIGAGELRAAVGERKNNDVKQVKTAALGYHYSLSKRTTVYADVVSERGTLTPTSRSGYDFGIKHNF